MAKVSKPIDPRQGDLFGGRETRRKSDVREGDLADDLALRALLTDDVRESGLSRYEIAGRMGHALGAEVTKWQLDAWTAESKEGHRFPLAYLAAWCWATGSERLIRHLSARLGLRLVTDTEVERAEIQREREDIRRRQRALHARERHLGGTR